MLENVETMMTEPVTVFQPLAQTFQAGNLTKHEFSWEPSGPPLCHSPQKIRPY